MMPPRNNNVFGTHGNIAGDHMHVNHHYAKMLLIDMGSVYVSLVHVIEY